MGFDVRFCYHVQPVFVTQFVEPVVIRIVACADGIDIQFFHTENILDHPFIRDERTSVRIRFMSVGSLEQHGFPVYKYLVAGQFDFTEPYLYRDDFQDRAFGR